MVSAREKKHATNGCAWLYTARATGAAVFLLSDVQRARSCSTSMTWRAWRKNGATGVAWATACYTTSRRERPVGDCTHGHFESGTENWGLVAQMGTRQSKVDERRIRMRAAT